MPISDDGISWSTLVSDIYWLSSERHASSFQVLAIFHQHYSASIIQQYSLVKSLSTSQLSVSLCTSNGQWFACFSLSQDIIGHANLWPRACKRFFLATSRIGLSRIHLIQQLMDINCLRLWAVEYRQAQHVPYQILTAPWFQLIFSESWIMTEWGVALIGV